MEGKFAVLHASNEDTCFFAFRLYDALTQQIKIALSYVDQKLTEKNTKSQDDHAETVQSQDTRHFLEYTFRSGLATIDRIQENSTFSSVLVSKFNLWSLTFACAVSIDLPKA